MWEDQTDKQMENDMEDRFIRAYEVITNSMALYSLWIHGVGYLNHIGIRSIFYVTL